VTASDDRRPITDGQVPPSVAARCEGCGLVYEVDLLGGAGDDLAGDCADCGSPVYAVPSGDEAVFLAGFGAGWDACAVFVQAAATGRQLNELTDGAEWAVRLAGGGG